MSRILWQSWSSLEAEFELERIKSLPFQHQWLNAHKNEPRPGDIWLTTNGYGFRNGPYYKATWYAESYQYLRAEYDRYRNDNKWDRRFHFNPTYSSQNKSVPLAIMTWWKQELQLFESTVNNKKPEFTFGMVLSKKPPDRQPNWAFGWFRSEIAEKSKGRSFSYYGGGWDRNDPNYKGEGFVNGHRGTPIKFNDARILMTKSKFVWCVENIHDPVYSMNYLTEKIWHGFLSASIPIYAGCWNVQDIIPADIFIDIRKFNYDVNAVCDYCEKMSDADYNGYLDRIGTFLRGPGQTFTCEERFLELDRKL